MNWTTEYPTQPGAYWIRNYRRFHLDSEPEIAEPVVVDVDAAGDFYCPGSERVHFKHHVLSAEWFGPIQPPQEEEQDKTIVIASNTESLWPREWQDKGIVPVVPHRWHVEPHHNCWCLEPQENEK